MGQTSSQLVATQDVPVPSQPATQLSALDGTQDDFVPPTQTQVRAVASTMDTDAPTVEDTVRKAQARRGKGKGAFGARKRKSVPQHMRGFAIQPSQEVPETLEENGQASAGAGQGDVRAGDGEGADGEEIVVSQPAGADAKGAAKTKSGKGKKRRLPWQGEHRVAPHAVGTGTAAGALEELDANALDEDTSPPTDQKKRRRKDIELERLRRDAEDFAPEAESTPQLKPASKRQKRARDADVSYAIEEQPEREEGQHVVPASARHQKRSKASRVVSHDETIKGAPGPTTAPSKSKRKIAAKASAEPDLEDRPDATASKTTSRRTQKAQPAVEPGQPIRDADFEEDSPSVEGGSAGDPPADSIPTPPESPDVLAPDPGEAEHGEDGECVEDVDGARRQRTGTAARAVQSTQAPEASSAVRRADQSGKPKKRNRVHEEDVGDIEDAQGERADVHQQLPANSRKRKTTKALIDHAGQLDDNYEEDTAGAQDTDTGDDDGATGAGRNSKRQKKTRKDAGKASEGDRGMLRGTWSKEERALADETFQDIVRVTAVPDWELKANIIDWKNPTPALGQMKEAFYDAFPKRDYRSIARFCQRRYNAFDRGKWTPEQDQLLRKAYELFPDQWTDISDHVGRFWEDCRMRWRDTLSRSEAVQETGPWSWEEELRLTKIVQECRQLVIKETEDEETREDPDKADALISWKVVSEKMDNTRNAKRCREKWAKMKRRDSQGNAAPDTTWPIKADKPTKRLLAVENDYQRCKTGDIYDILTEICAAVPDTARIFDYETTFWSVVAMKNPGSRFNSSLRRRAFSAAIEEYSCKAVSSAETLAGKAKGVKERMEILERKGKIDLMRAYEGKVKGKESRTERTVKDGEAPVKKKKSRVAKAPKQTDVMDSSQINEESAPTTKAPAEKPKRAKKTSASKPKEAQQFKSADLVVESDEEPTDNDNVQVTQTPTNNGDLATSEHEEDKAEEHGTDGRPADAGKQRARQQSEEMRSLSETSPKLDHSSFIDLLKGGKRIWGGKKNKS